MLIKPEISIKISILPSRDVGVRERMYEKSLSISRTTKYRNTSFYCTLLYSTDTVFFTNWSFVATRLTQVHWHQFSNICSLWISMSYLGNSHNISNSSANFIQLTLVLHGFELKGSTYCGFFQKIYSKILEDLRQTEKNISFPLT